MANVKVELDLDWLNDDFGVSLEDEVKSKIISDITNKVNLKITETLDKKVMEVVEANVNNTVGEYLKNIMSEKIESIQIPYKSSEWGSKMTFIPLSEYVGMKYNQYLSEKTLDEDGRIATYSSAKKYTVIDFYLQGNVKKAIDVCIEKTLKEARTNTIAHISETLKKQIQSQLNADIVSKLNIEKIIKDLTANLST